MKIKSSSRTVSLLGDLLGSRRDPDRVETHQKVVEVLADVSRLPGCTDPLRATVGDEFQGVFDSLGAAMRATFEIRLSLHGVAEVRFGIGSGWISTLDEKDHIQDGSAWWTAREAIDATKARARDTSLHARTTFCSAVHEQVYVRSVQTSLELVDFAYGSLGTTDVRILRHLRDGVPQKVAAQRLGISPQAVSQRVRRRGISLINDCMREMEQLT